MMIDDYRNWKFSEFELRKSSIWRICSRFIRELKTYTKTEIFLAIQRQLLYFFIFFPNKVALYN